MNRYRLIIQTMIATALVIAGLLVLYWGVAPLFDHNSVRSSNFKVVFPVQQRYAEREVRM